MISYKNLLLLVAGFLATQVTLAQPDKWGLPSSPNGTLIASFLDAVNDSDSGTHRTFIESHFTSDFRNAMPMENHLEHFKQMHNDLKGAEVNGVDMMMSPDGTRNVKLVMVSPEEEYWNVTLDVASADQPKIAGLQVELSPDGPPAVEKLITTLLETINDSDTEAHRTFIETYFAPSFKDDLPIDTHLAQFQQLHQDLSGAEMVSAEAMSRGGTDESISLMMEAKGGKTFKLEFDVQTTTTPPRLITLNVAAE